MDGVDSMDKVDGMDGSIASMGSILSTPSIAFLPGWALPAWTIAKRRFRPQITAPLYG